MIALLMALNTAQAAPMHSVALDVGRMDSPTRGLDVLGGQALATYGFRFVYDLERWRWLDVTGSLRFSEKRSQNTLRVDYTGVSIPDGQGFEARWFHNTAALGLRVQARSSALQPYGRVQGSLETGVLRLDEDIDAKDNVNELREIGLAPGVELVAGLDLLTAPYGMDMGLDISPVFFLEMGWNRTGLMDLGDYGEMRYGGFVIRTGLGVAF